MTTEQFLIKVFNKYDSNGDNRLSKFQFADVLKFLTKTLGVTLPNKKDLESIFGILDSDADRSISKEEFRKLAICLEPVIK